MVALWVITLGGSAQASDPSRVCAVAEALVHEGRLAEAAHLYKLNVAGEPVECAAEGLNEVDLRLQSARKADASGQQLLREGNLPEAQHAFEHALQQDVADAPALRGIARIEELDRNAAAKLKWNNFYDNWFLLAVQLLVPSLIAFAALMSVSGLLSGWLVRVDAVEWPVWLRWLVGFPGVIVLLGTAAMLPVYPMFKPFEPDDVLPAPAIWAGAVLFVLTLCAVAWVTVTGYKRDRWETGNPLKHWCRLLVSMAFIGGMGLAIAVCLLDDSDRRLLSNHRLLVAYAVLTLYGVLLTGAVLGQNLRLQVAVQTPKGKTDAAATDYLLARMQTLGAESPRRLFASANRTPLSSALSGEALSALPAGAIVGTLSSLFFTVRPDMTWRARANILDDNRVAITLSRNGTHAESTIFSRQDLGLPLVEDASGKDRTQAQLLTGAAAYILVYLSRRHRRGDGVYGARSWKSVTLQVIATSKSLIDHPALRTGLLAQAVNEDPNNALARLEYLLALQEETARDDPAYVQFANDLDSEIRHRPELKDSTPLRVRALYRSTAHWINLYVQNGYQNRNNELAKARRQVTALQSDLQKIKEKRNPRLTVFVEQMQQLANVLQSDVDALQNPILPNYPERSLVPRVAYENACLECFIGRRSAGRVNEAIEHLRYALPTEWDKEEAREENCLAVLREESAFQRLTDQAVLPEGHTDAMRRHRRRRRC
jgi:hypothetical protein